MAQTFRLDEALVFIFLFVDLLDVGKYHLRFMSVLLVLHKISSAEVALLQNLVVGTKVFVQTQSAL